MKFAKRSPNTSNIYLLNCNLSFFQLVNPSKESPPLGLLTWVEKVPKQQNATSFDVLYSNELLNQDDNKGSTFFRIVQIFCFEDWDYTRFGNCRKEGNVIIFSPHLVWNLKETGRKESNYVKNTFHCLGFSLELFSSFRFLSKSSKHRIRGWQQPFS